MTQAEKDKASMDLFNKDTKPEFHQKVEDFFNKPVIATQIQEKKPEQENQNIEDLKTELLSEANTSTPKGEKNLYQRLQEMPYSKDRIGRGFVIPWSKPK